MFPTSPLFGNIQITTQAIQVLCEQDVPVTYFSMGGWFYGITRGHELKNVFLRMEQFRFARDPITCLALARQFVHGKIRNHRTMLMRNHVEPPASIILKLKRAADDALEATSLEQLLGIEGAAASQYFQHFNGMIKEADAVTESQAAPLPNFNFSTRNRRPPPTPSMRFFLSVTACSAKIALWRASLSVSTHILDSIISLGLVAPRWDSILWKSSARSWRNHPC